MSAPTGSRAEPSPKSHQPLAAPVERIFTCTCKPCTSLAKLAAGLLGLMTCCTNAETYMAKAPEARPAAVPTIALSQLSFFSSSLMGSSLTEVAQAKPPPAYAKMLAAVEVDRIAVKLGYFL